MLTLALLLATIGQNFQPGDTLMLAGERNDALVPAAVYSTDLVDFIKHINAADKEGVREKVVRGDAFTLEPGTTARFLERVDFGSKGVMAEVRVLDGKYAGKQAHVMWVHCRTVDPAFLAARKKAVEDAHAWEVAKDNRKPLDSAAIAKDLRDAIKGAKTAASKMGPTAAALRKERLVKEAIEKVRRKHVAEPDELLAIANGATPPITIGFDGKLYDVLGGRVK